MKKILIALVVIAAGLYWFTHRATSVNSTDAPGFKPLRDDALAQKYRPYLLASEFGKPQALYYRASRSGEKLYITYHYVWDREVNNAEGWKPWLSRNLYTGGLALQRTMFGKGDIEMVSLVLDDAQVIADPDELNVLPLVDAENINVGQAHEERHRDGQEKKRHQEHQGGDGEKQTDDVPLEKFPQLEGRFARGAVGPGTEASDRR